VITAHEIKNYGWRSLIDILRSVAGIDINDRGYSSDIGMRGINPLQNNGNGILFLLDGHDMSWRQLQQNLALASWISVDDIDRIEVIRGPVSGLWGRGSLHGAINIITKSGAGLSGYAGTMGIGLPGGSHFFNLRAGNRFASGLSLYATLSLRNEYRSAVIAPIFEFINTPANLTYISPDDRNLGQDFYFKADWNGLFLTVHQSRFDATAPLNQYALIGGDETRFVTDRIIARLGWQGTIGKWAHLQVWAAFDRMSFASDTSVTFNPLSKNTSSPKSAGMSDTYLLTRRKVDGEGKEQIETLYAPSCEILSSPETAKSACVRLGMVEYQDNENKTQRTAACVLVENRDVKPTTGAQKVSLEERYQTWFPSADCQRIYSDGSHRQPLRAEDNRIEIGTQLSLAFLEWLHLMAGLQFEYLQSTLWHFTNFWESQIAGQNIESELPNYANIRFGAYLQAQAKIGHWGMVSAAGRLDIDERLGARFSPQIGAVVTPGFDLFIKLNYALGSRAASLYEQFFYEQNRYGNPGLLDEEVHTISLQVGWLRRELVYVALSGFFSIYNNPIISQSVGNNQPVANAEKFIYPTPNPSGTYHQLINRENGYTSLGGEIEARLFPLYGFEARAFFGIALATEVINEQGDADRMPYSAGLYSGLEATYRYEFFRASLGLLYTGSKIAPVTSFDIKGNLPVRGLVDADQAKPIPNWSANSHPRAPSVEEIPRAEGYIKLHITIQFLNLFKHFDLSLRAQNILFMGDAYDAGNPLLYPQKRFEFLAWLNFHY
jgi:outer membrane receptor protein involved in Fe transport